MDSDLVNICVFGPGYGESILINIPHIGWGIIDSCYPRIKGKQENPALKYLKRKNVSKLAFLILTHPHEDHYLGFDEIIEFYLGRIDRICIYNGDGIREYREYLSKKELLGGKGLRSFSNVFRSAQEAKKRGANFIKLSERTEIIRRGNYGNHEVEILALSPSAESVQRYRDILFEAIPRKDGDVIHEIPDTHHNLLSSAIWCSIGNLRLIFSSDVENGKCGQIGWKGILNNVDCPSLSAHVVKVPHHGSPNAFYDPVWEKFSQEASPLSIITPFDRASNPLPKENIVIKIAKFSHAVAITSKTKFLKPEKVYNRTAIKHAYGVKNWKVLVEPDQIGCVKVDLLIDSGDISNLEFIHPAYLYKNKNL